MDCIFCAIVAGDLPASVVDQDDDTLAFMDIRPITPGHLLVIPKEHATDLSELPGDIGGIVMQTAMRCAAALRASDIPTEGINLFLADGPAAGQVVFHAHLHVIPRTRGDGFRIGLDYPDAPDRTALDDHAAAIAASLE